MSACGKCGAGPISCAHRTYEAPVLGDGTKGLWMPDDKPKKPNIGNTRTGNWSARGRYR